MHYKHGNYAQRKTARVGHNSGRQSQSRNTTPPLTPYLTLLRPSSVHPHPFLLLFFLCRTMASQTQLGVSGEAMCVPYSGCEAEPQPLKYLWYILAVEKSPRCPESVPSVNSYAL